MSDTAPKLTWAFDLTIKGYGTFPYKATKHSAICCAHVASGTFVSADGKINLIVKAGTDWMTVHDDYVEIDARVCCESTNLELESLNVDVAYLGRCELSKETTAIFNQENGAGDDPKRSYYYTTPYLSSRSKELSWVNEAVFVASGTASLTDDGIPTVLYRIYKVG